MRRSLAAATVLMLCLCCPSFADEPADARVLDMFGWVERVELLDGQLKVKAKLDSGAATSSLDATNMHRFERDGERWIRFEVEDPESDKPIKVERPIVRNVRIVRHSGEHQRRPVVTLDVCFGSHRREVEFSLVDRAHFIYPVLLGRSALKGKAVIDPAATFLNDPKCKRTGGGDAESDGE